MQDSTVTLVERVLEVSQEKQLSWESTGIDNQFSLQLPSGTIIIRKFRDDDGENFQITLLNSDGVELDSYWTWHSMPHFDLLESLYGAARNKALRVDETIKDMLEDLDK